MIRRLLLLWLAVALLLCTITPGFGMETMNFSCSAQVAHAFGQGLMDVFIEESGIAVNTHVSSSGLAINRLLNGFSDIAGSARPLRPNEIESGLIEIPICRDAMAIIVNRDNPVDGLSGEQVRRIFDGELNNWNAVNGVDLPIRVVAPGSHTAAFENFQKMALGMNDIRYAFTTWKSTDTVEAVRYLPGAISFIGHVAVHGQKDIRALSINGQSITDTSYPYRQVFSLVTRGKPSAKARVLIDFALSDKVTKFIVEHNMIPVID